MIQKTTFFGTLVGLGFLFGVISGAIASEMNMNNTQKMQTEVSKIQFQVIDQPLANKILVTVGGIGLIGTELWWFLFSKSKSH